MRNLQGRRDKRLPARPRHRQCHLPDAWRHRLATAAQAVSARTRPCMSPQAVPVSLSLRHRQLCSPMEGLLSACVLLSGAAETRMPAAGVEGSQSAVWEEPGVGIGLQVGGKEAPKPRVWWENSDFLSPAA